MVLILQYPLDDWMYVNIHHSTRSHCKEPNVPYVGQEPRVAESALGASDDLAAIVLYTVTFL